MKSKAIIMELRECRLCNEHVPNVWFRIYKYNEIFICNHCTELGLFRKKPVIILNHIQCPVCLEMKKGIELPNCSHMLCIDCCKYIYYGPNINSYTNRMRSVCSLPIFPYYDTYKEYEWTIWEDYDFHKTLTELLEERNQKKPTRPRWMNTKTFLKYEMEYMQYWIEQFLLDDEDATRRNQIDANIQNARCPLCRK